MPAQASILSTKRYVSYGLTLVLAIMLLLSLGVGAYQLSLSKLVHAVLGQATDLENFLLWQVRIPRICLALVVGAGLASTGAAVQGLFRNPLAEPTFIGITSGAMLFAVLALVAGRWLWPELPALWQQLSVSIAAFFGALGSTFLVYRIAAWGQRLNVTTMLLAGIAITSLAAAFTGLLIYQSSENELRDITFWTLGSLAGANWWQVLICAPIVVVGGHYLQGEALALNAFLLGEQEAAQLGFQVQRIKRRIIIWTALIVGACISVTGLIGFVGLVIPHLLRLLVGTDYRQLLWYSIMLGGSFLLGADALARTVVAPAELPIGILTALVGAPFFIWLLLRQRQQNLLL